MTNRLRSALRTLIYCVGLLLAFTNATRLAAQPGFFNFSYTGPDSVIVGANCNNPLQGNIPNPIVSSTIGATITMSMFDDVNSGYPFNQLFTAGEIAHVYWFVKDDMGHSHSFEFFIRFVDRTAPVFNLTGIADTIYLASVVQVQAPPNIPTIDNCTTFSTTFVETTRPDTCLAGSFARTWTATDLAGNKSTFTQTIIIAADNAPPTITFPPQNGSAPCAVLNTAYPAWRAAQMANFTAQDPSGIKSLTNNGPASFPPGCTVPLTVVFKATDNCNLMISATAVFTTSDNQGPVVVVAPKDTVAYCSPGGNHMAKLNEWINKRAYSQVYDSCSTPITYSMKRNNVLVDSAGVVAAFWASFDNPCGTQMIGTKMVDKVSAFVTVDFFARDACGNETFVGKRTFAAVDTLPPVITGINTSEQCGGGDDQAKLQTWINAKGNATFSDDCSTAFWTGFSFTTSNGQSGTGAFNSGPYPTIVANNCTWFTDVTFHASDECGNASSKTLRFQIVDTTPPVFTGLAPNITVYCPQPLPTTPAATITDNCDLSLAISFTRVYKDTICAGSYTVLTTWKATDDCGNTATITQNIFVQDTTRPVFTLVPPGLIMRCDTFALPPVPVQGQNINATDICSPVTSITTATASNQNPNPSLCGHYSYNLVRTFTATDQCGNTRTATQLISVIDNQAPVPGGVLDTTALCSALTPFPAPAPNAVDACAGPTAPPVYVSTQTINGACAGQYTLKLNWVATDVCGNQTTFQQTVHVVDTVAPVLSNIPANITVECNAIPAQPNTNSFNGADNCAASVAVNLAETEIRNPNLNSCDHWNNYTIRRQWTATDDCGNARTYTQNIQVVDTTPPVLVAPAAITLPNDMGNCGATIPIPAPESVFDLCTSGTIMVSMKDTLSMTGDSINLSVPVDTMVFQFSLPNSLPLQPAVGNVVLGIYIEMADANGPQEYFNIYGENGVFLDTTARTANQCMGTPSYKTVTLSAAQFNNWASDGELVITLAPNGFGANAINLTCPGVVRMNLDYNYSVQHVPLTLTYSLDGSPSAPYPPSGATFLAAGSHTVVYTATDCVNNNSTASVQIQVNDVQPPSITAPAPITAYVGPGVCSTMVKLPFPVISENCRMSGEIMKSSIVNFLSFSPDPDAPDLVPDDVLMNIPALIPNAVGNGVLSIKFKGDNNGPREFFNLFQGANQITTTNFSTASGACQDTIITSIAVSPAAINTWAATGMAVFRAEANTNPGPLFDFDFINPCAPVLPNGTDGVSFIQVMLQYNYAVINFEIRKGNTLVATGNVVGNQTMVNLAPGAYTVKYTTTDNAGLVGMTTFALNVLDTIKPVATCKPNLTIEVNPSGLPGSNYLLQPSEINTGSSDNCPGGLTYSMSQSTFTCHQSGNNYLVTLTVTDISGNSSSCSTTVKVERLPPMPSFDPVCEGDTLQLYTNPPAPASAFTYNWTGPSFSVTQQNPARYNAPLSFQGLYTVTISGTTGCTVSGSVTVNFANLAVPDISVSGGNMNNFCQGQNIILNTPTNPNNNVNYLWYADASPNPILLATTTTNTYTIFQPSPGQYRFFVKVKIGECLTPNSIYLTVNVYSRPVALVGNDSISICAGELLALSTPVSAPGLTYLWSGTNGFSSPFQNPTVTNNAAPVHAGIYTLKTFQNGCESIPSDTTIVTIRYTPPKPTIINSLQACVGTTFTFWASNGGGNVVSYHWQHPVLGNFTTNNAQLPIPDVNLSHCGKWKVRTMSLEGCFSPWSDEVDFCPQEYPDLVASSNSPVCAGAPVSLSATNLTPGLSLTYTWTLPNNSQVLGQNPTVIPAQNGDYQVIAKTSYMCADTAMVSVQVVNPPVVTGIVKSGPTCVDSLSNACLMPQVSSPNGPFTYTWTKSGFPAFMVLTKDLCFNPVVFNDNGIYTLVVEDTFGCASAPAFDSITVLPYVKVPRITLSPTPVCAGGTVTLTVTNSSDYNGGTPAEYHWIRPSGPDTITSGPILVLTNVTVSQSGNYQVFVKKGACQSVLSDLKMLLVNPTPPTPVASSNQPVCLGSTLFLTANAIPGATYSWIGANFTSADKDPVRPNVVANYEGTYTVHVVVDGCASGTSTVYVDVMAPPATPIIAPPSPTRVCLDQAIAEFIRINNPVFGTIYSWIDPDTGDTLQHMTNHFLNFANLPDSLRTPGLHRFQVSGWKQDNPNGQGCSTVLSNIVEVMFDTIPNIIATTDPNHPACVTPSTPIILNAVPPTNGITGEWKQTGGPVYGISDKNAPNTQFAGVSGNTYTFSWCLTSGGCANFSCANLTITAVPPETANAGPDQDVCPGATSVSLNAVQGQHSPGSWSQLGQIGVSIADSLEPMSPVTGLNPGNRYFFTWTLADIGCGEASDVVAITYYSVKPDIIGDPFPCSEENCTLLQAQGLQSWESGQWTGQPASLVFTPPNHPITKVCGLVPGLNRVFWTTNNGFCGDNSRDTFDIHYEIYPTAVNDYFQVDFGTATAFQVLTNDILPTDPPTVAIIIQPMNGTVTANNTNGSFTYRPFSGFAGEDALVYQICNSKCGPNACSNATVFFTVGQAGACDIPTIITPNGDDFNDVFKIPGDCYVFGEGQSTIAEVTIFNQWGDHVFNDKAFLPSSSWDGQYNGEKLPAGTYYWVVKFEAEEKARSGFLLIQH
jgi:gliding motility-associated-like protein